MDEENNVKLDFIGISDPRAGSSWIYDVLEEHPEICMSKKKEAQLFGQKYSKRYEYYKKFFAHCSGKTLRGTYSPQYLRDAKALARIKKHLPSAKLIANLRNPIDRIYAIYWYNRLGGTGASWQYKDFEEAVQDAEFLKRASYAEHIRNLLNTFPREQILFVLYDDIKDNPRQLTRDIYKFLGVDESFTPEMIQKRVKPSGSNRIKRPLYAKLFFRTIHFFRKFSFTRKMINKAKDSNALYRVYRRLTPKRGPSDKQFKRPPMSEETREYLRKYFKEDIREVERLIGRELGNWK